MKNTCTIHISTSKGHPRVIMLPIWLVRSFMIGLFVMPIMLGLALFGATIYYLQATQQALHLEAYIKENTLLRQQLAVLDDDEALQNLISSFSAEPSDIVDEEQYLVSEYLSPLEVSLEGVSKSGNILTARIMVTRNKDSSASVQGAFMFVIFENLSENKFISSPKTALNNEGFPKLYKRGLLIPTIKNWARYRRSIRLDAPDDVFTHVVVYLFSLRGGMLQRERHALHRDIFSTNS